MSVSSVSATSPNLLGIAPEIWQHYIFAALPQKDLQNAALVCKVWDTIIKTLRPTPKEVLISFWITIHWAVMHTGIHRNAFTGKTREAIEQEYSVWLQGNKALSIVSDINHHPFPKKLVFVPKELLQFANLRSLSLSSNELEKNPIELLQLKNLEYINLAYNKLKKFPIELLGLPQLYWLKVNNNCIDDFSSIGFFTKVLSLIQYATAIFANSWPTILMQNRAASTFKLVRIDIYKNPGNRQWERVTNVAEVFFRCLGYFIMNFYFLYFGFVVLVASVCLISERMQKWKFLAMPACIKCS